MCNRLLSACLLGLGLAGAALPAAAQMSPLSATLPTVAQYSDRPSFAAASLSLTTLDFRTANTSGGTLTVYANSAGLTFYGVNFVGTENAGRYSLSVNTPAFYPVYAGFSGEPTGLLAGDNSAYNSPVTTITLPPGTTAVGTDLYTIRLGDFGANSVEPLDITLYSGATALGTYQVLTYEKPTLAFAGFVSTLPITSMTVTGENDSLCDLSTFVFGSSLAAGSKSANNDVQPSVFVAALSPDVNKLTQINVTTTNNGSFSADQLQITSVTFNSAVPLPAPTSPSPVPTTPDLLAPGHSQVNGFKFNLVPGTTLGVFKISGTYIDTSTGKPGAFATTIRRLRLPQPQN